jgi:hypothetical protein
MRVRKGSISNLAVNNHLMSGPILRVLQRGENVLGMALMK